MNELESIDKRIAEQQAIIDKLSADMKSHGSIVKSAFAKIQSVSLAALGLNDAKAQLELQQAEQETVLASQRSASYSAALNQANERLTELRGERAALIQVGLIADHDSVKVDTIQTAHDFGQRAEVLKELLSEMRDHTKELINTARLAGLDSLAFNRLQTLTTDWLQARLFSSVRIPPYLDKPFGEVVADFLAHRSGVESNDDEREVA